MRRFSTLLLLSALALAPSRTRGDDFPTPHNSEKEPGEPQPADKAAASMKVPPGFKVTLFASEPAVRNPIGMTWDARGRLWIAENYTYAERGVKFDLRLRDRVLIFEDRDGDGKADGRKVFTEDVQKLTSVEVGRGGVWLMCPPQLLFLPDRDGDDVPDGPAEVVLDGFSLPPENYHNLANGLRWGPDGWLYGRCGASAPGRIGAPGVEDAKRVPLNGGLWRYDLKTKVFEVVAHGTTNPWGHDWNALGEAFFINTVNGHLWHAVAGSHLMRPHTLDPNPSVYVPIDTHADHWHWDESKTWSDSRNVVGEHDRKGGGHAHSGMMIYGGKQWPESYRDKLFTLNLHGRRVNVDRLERSGAGYVGKHEPDMIRASDPWFRGLDLREGPDGSVFIIDWSDFGECHENTGVHRTSGRIYRVSYGDPPARPAEDLSKLDSLELIRRIDEDELFTRRARLILADRAGKPGEPSAAIRERLVANIKTSDSPRTVLRSLWALNAAVGVGPEGLELAKHPHEAVRAWGIRLATDRMPIDDIMSRRAAAEVRPSPELMDALVEIARRETSGLVRLVLASTLQRLPLDQRLALAEPLTTGTEFHRDHDLPLLIWYGLIPLAESDPVGLARLVARSKFPMTTRLGARRLVEGLEKDPRAVEVLVAALPELNKESAAEILGGFADGLKGYRKAPKPRGWDAVAERFQDDSVARELGVVFGDGRALAEVRALALNDKAPLDVRKAALRSLIESRPDDLRVICEKLLGTRFLNAVAARGLSLFDDPEVGLALVKSYRTFHPSERPAVLDTLVSRPPFARALVEGMAGGRIPPAELSAFQARQIRSLGDPALNKKLAEVWGEVRDAGPEKKQAIATWKGKLSATAPADSSAGRAVFAKICASCHTLYGVGGAIGPDLTGAGRDNLDYLLENIVDPSAVVTADYRMVVVAMKDGRVLNGIVKASNDRTMSLQTQNELLALDRREVEEIKPTTASLMPDGLIDPLKPEEVRDLFGYLRGRTQVPLPKP